MIRHIFLVLGVLFWVDYLAPFAYSELHPVIRKINERLDTTTLSGPHDIEIRYRQGKVMLAGSISTPSDSKMVEDLIQSIDGVQLVQNNLVISDSEVPAAQAVKRPSPTDSQIRSQVLEALSDSENLNTGKITVDVADGQVTLRGDQPNFRAVDQLLAVVLMVDGVKDIRSEMTVVGKPYPAKKPGTPR